MKFGLSQILHPTPAKLKIFGKALVTATVTAASLNTVNGGSSTISAVLILSGFVGQFLTSLFGSQQEQA